MNIQFIFCIQCEVLNKNNEQTMSTNKVTTMWKNRGMKEISPGIKIFMYLN